MKSKFSILLIFILMFSLVGAITTQAWMPSTHLYIMNEAQKQAPNSPVGLVIQNNFEDYAACNYLTDISVFYYFSEGFGVIGKQYKSTHSTVLCKRAVELALKNNDQRQLACAYGICAHHTEDTVSHNSFVPRVVESSLLPNGIVHALAEEKVDDQIRNEGLKADINYQLLNYGTDFEDFFIELAQSSGNFEGIPDVSNLYNAFIKQVTSEEKYSVGFQGFTAVPFSMHLILILLFVFSLVGMSYLIRRPKKNIFNKISIGIFIFLVLFILGVYALFFSGNLFSAFQTFSYPLSQPLPTAGWEQDVQQSITNTVNFMNQGATYVNGIKDPAGSTSLGAADATGDLFRGVVSFVFILLIFVFAWLNFRKVKRK